MTQLEFTEFLPVFILKTKYKSNFTVQRHSKCLRNERHDRHAHYRVRAVHIDARATRLIRTASAELRYAHDD